MGAFDSEEKRGGLYVWTFYVYKSVSFRSATGVPKEATP